VGVVTVRVHVENFKRETTTSNEDWSMVRTGVIYSTALLGISWDFDIIQYWK